MSEEELFGTGNTPEYPWQLELPEQTPNAKRTKAERKADFVRYQFDFWKGLPDEDFGGHPLLFLDEGRGFFRFSDGTFALSRERSNWPASKETGFFPSGGCERDATVGRDPPRVAGPRLSTRGGEAAA